jgi:hypothetical protein
LDETDLPGKERIRGDPRGPGVRPTIYPESFFSASAFAAIENCDVLFGCVDNDGSGLGLLEACCASRKPYIDLATDVESDGSFGGRLIVTSLGKGCPFFRDEL